MLAGRRTCASCYIATIGATSDRQRRLATRYDRDGDRFSVDLCALGAALTCCKVMEPSQEFNTEGVRNDK